MNYLIRQLCYMAFGALLAIGALAARAAEPIDVSGQITITRGGFILNRTTNTFDQTVTVKNNGLAVSAPIWLVVSSISPSSVKLANGTGLTSSGKPYVSILASGALSTGQSISRVLKFNNTARVTFSYTAQVFATKSAEIGKDVISSDPPAISPDTLAALPVNPETGRPVLFALSQGSLELDESLNDAVTARAQCLGWITHCIEPGQRELDDCARSARKCATSTPWLESTTCCPSACFEQYKTKRLSGIEPLTAFSSVYLTKPGCFSTGN